jgi:hypothetical protein
LAGHVSGLFGLTLTASSFRLSKSCCVICGASTLYREPFAMSLLY